MPRLRRRPIPVVLVATVLCAAMVPFVTVTAAEPDETLSAEEIYRLLTQKDYQRALDAIEAAERESFVVAVMADGFRLSALAGLERWKELETTARRLARTAQGAESRLRDYEPGPVLSQEMLDSSGSGARATRAQANYYLGLALFRQEDERHAAGEEVREERLQEAEEALRRALYLSERHVPYARLVLVWVNQWQGEPRQALRALRPYLEEHPDDQGAQELERSLEAQAAEHGG